MTTNPQWRVPGLLILLAGIGLGCTDDTSIRAPLEESLSEEILSEESEDGEEFPEDAESDDPNRERSKDTCTEPEDCPDRGSCWEAASCDDGACTWSPAPMDTSCGTFCNPGVCDGAGECALQPPFSCPDLDGSVCTVPTCSAEFDECIEKVLPNGSPPYASSDCFTGGVCVEGELDLSATEPSEIASACELQSAGLDPLGCVERFECVGGEEGCAPIFRADGLECWPDEGGEDATCTGHSCLDGECVADSTFSKTCTPEDFSDSCDASCAACTDLVCHWIEPPSNPGADLRVPYCKPAAAVGEPCSIAASCAVEQTCMIQSETSGPLGKETLGVCAGQGEKSPEACAQELGLNPLPCVLAGMDCEDGCVFNEAKAATWCTPPSSLCFEPTNTLCSHIALDSENWDPETGCQVAWVDVDCDDDNSCTVDACFKGESGWTCSHDPIEGAACEDGDPCSTKGLCAGGECTGIAPICPEDGNPCTLTQCAGGECSSAPTDGGTACTDGSVCTVFATCDGQGECVPEVELPCEDNNPCTIDGCSPETGCFHVAQTGSCEDGDPCTVEGQCIDGVCTGQLPLCTEDDGNPCTAPACDGGECLWVPSLTGLPCDDGSVCSTESACGGSGVCEATAFKECDDGNACTTDGCDALTGCFHDPLSGACEDGNGCTVGDQCSNGLCVPGGPLSCDDGESCTSDGCIAGACIFEPVEGVCDDGDPCSGADSCVDGECVGIPGAVFCSDDNPCTEDFCGFAGECQHAPIPDGLPCEGGSPFSCQSGECVCVSQCTVGLCGNGDQCGGVCGCVEGEACSGGKCVPDTGGGVDYDGVYQVTGNNNMVPVTMTLDFDATTSSVSGAGVISALGFLVAEVDYTGTYTHPDFTLEGSYKAFGIIQHNETWTLSFAPETTSPIQFTGLLQDTAETSDFDVVGVKTQ